MLSYLKRIYGGSKSAFCKELDDAIEREQKQFVITANPEIIMLAEQNPELQQLLLSKDSRVVPDGISIVRAMRQMGYPAAERIAGIDLAEHLLHCAGKKGKSVYLLGAREEVVSTLAETCKKTYPAMELKFHNGYDGNKDEIFTEEIKKQAPDVIIVALGVPNQELLIARHVQAFNKGIFIGVGGSFDVLSGKKKRAPRIFLRTNTEWLYRLITEPFRIRRFVKSNLRFLRRMSKIRKESKRNGKN